MEAKKEYDTSTFVRPRSGGASDEGKGHPATPAHRTGQSQSTKEGGDDVGVMSRGRRNPLHEFSLRGDGRKLHARAVDTKPLLGEFIMAGQTTVIYARPNAGKTLTIIRLILDAVEEERLDPDALFYVNADDNGKGLAEKVELLERVGAHVLAPGLKGFKANQFVDKLTQGAEDGTARGTVVIIDTLKKFTNLMDKGRSSEFAQVCRLYAMAGGTIIALAHTAKNRKSDGGAQYQGTTDIVEDFDAAYIAEPMSAKAGSGEKVIRFAQEKTRADSPEVVAYAYSTEAGLTYHDKLASLRPLYPEELDDHTLDGADVDDRDVVEEIRGYLVCGHGHVGLDKIVRAVAHGGEFSRATVRRVLDQYTGPDSKKHRWNFDRGDRGRRTYYLLSSD